MLQLLKQRHHKFRQRRIEDTRDEDSQITGQIQSKGLLTYHFSALNDFICKLVKSPRFMYSLGLSEVSEANC